MNNFTCWKVWPFTQVRFLIFALFKGLKTLEIFFTWSLAYFTEFHDFCGGCSFVLNLPAVSRLKAQIWSLHPKKSFVLHKNFKNLDSMSSLVKDLKLTNFSWSPKIFLTHSSRDYKFLFSFYHIWLLTTA